MRAKNMYNKLEHIWKALNGSTKRVYYILLSLSFIILLGNGELHCSPVLHRIPQSNLNKAQDYFQLNPFTTIRLANKSYLLVDADLKLNSDITGEGSLILSSRQDIRLSTRNNAIHKLCILNNTLVKLEGRLTIVKKISLIGKSTILLGDCDLILTSDINMNYITQHNIQRNGIGRLIVASMCLSLAPKLSHIQHPYSTIGFPPHAESIIITYFNIPYSAFLFEKRYNQIYYEIGTPPPKIPG